MNQKLTDTWKEVLARPSENNSIRNEQNSTVLSTIIPETLPTYIGSLLDSAQHTIIICSFLLADRAIEEKLKKASKRGVRIYLLLACENTLDNDAANDDEFAKYCLDYHTKFLKNIKGRAMIRSAPYFHAKVVLVDAITANKSQAQGLLLTANLTEDALSRNEELAVVLNLDQIEDLTEIFRWAFFESAKHQIIDGENFDSIKPLGKVPHPSLHKSISFTSSQSTSLKNEVQLLIDQAQKQLILSSFGFEENFDIIEAISRKALSGVKVTVLARDRDYNLPSLRKLRQAGAEVKVYRWLHAKAIWNDLNQGLIYSANFQRRGLDSGFETGVRLKAEQATELKIALYDFMKRKHRELVEVAN